MMDDKAVLLDTNVLLSATAPHRPLHQAALVVLNDWPNQTIPLATSTQVFREYLVVATRPAEVNGLGLGLDEALANLAAFRARMRLLLENEQAWDRLRALLATYGSLGKQIHDANLVATSLASGVARLVTANVEDFRRFKPEIEIIDLGSIPLSSAFGQTQA
ncbi:MAG TPA: PIN domain-containing protein [Thermoanaerobaculia bacterium]|nr:PIN domain-containing protein [Thermoanaerobaculia bacterium]